MSAVRVVQLVTLAVAHRHALGPSRSVRLIHGEHSMRRLVAPRVEHIPLPRRHRPLLQHDERFVVIDLLHFDSIEPLALWRANAANAERAVSLRLRVGQAHGEIRSRCYPVRGCPRLHILPTLRW